MLSFNGWINGLTASGVLVVGIIIGLFCIYESTRTNARLLKYLGIAIIFESVIFFANFCDFLHILFTGKNLDLNIFKILGPLSYMWIAPGGVIFAYIAVESILSERKLIYNLLLYTCIIIGVLYVIVLFFDFFFNSLVFSKPSNPGQDLIDDSFIIGSPLFIVSLIGNVILNALWGIGFLLKSFQSKGILRKKSLLLSLGFPLFFVGLILDGAFNLAFVRLFILIGFWIMYLGLREEPAEKITYEKEVHVEGGIFRISKYRRGEITEEEVSISKEKKICLVCKGKVGRFMYMCPECETFYCEKCARALIELENACWACNTSIDESRPLKPFKKKEDIAEIEISEKFKK